MSTVMRQQYRELSADEKLRIVAIKVKAQELYDLVESLLEPTSSGGITLPRVAVCGREVALAKTKIEEAVMWATKAATA